MPLNRMRARDVEPVNEPVDVPVQRVEDPAAPIGWPGYRADRSNRFAGLAGTAAIYALMLAGFFLTMSHVAPVKTPPPALTVFDMNLPASPPEIPPQEKEAPKPVKEKEQPETPRPQPIEPSIVPIAPVSVPMPVAKPRPVDPGPVEPETATPKTMPAPPAPQVASNGPDTWEGQVLAALNKRRRYPIGAMTRRQQGVPYVRFVMDRNGKVLSSRLERSSGFADLDREATALPRRAQPLPQPPNDVQPGAMAIELVVPVEFFLGRRS